MKASLTDLVAGVLLVGAAVAAAACGGSDVASQQDETNAVPTEKVSLHVEGMT